MRWEHPSRNMIYTVTKAKKVLPTVYNPTDLYEPLLATRGNKALVAISVAAFTALAYQTLKADYIDLDDKRYHNDGFFYIRGFWWKRYEAAARWLWRKEPGDEVVLQQRVDQMKTMIEQVKEYRRNNEFNHNFGTNG